jgi:hypothetical protein
MIFLISKSATFRSSELALKHFLLKLAHTEMPVDLSGHRRLELKVSSDGGSISQIYYVLGKHAI